jgi:hypothetical protein
LVYSTDNYPDDFADCHRHLFFSEGQHMKRLLSKSWQGFLRPKNSSVMNVPFVPIRYRAVAMELAAYPDDKNVEMHILTNTGRSITIVCDHDSIFSIQRHIEQIGRACPEILTWKNASDTEGINENNCRSYEAALWEGWPLFKHRESNF